MNRKLLFGVPIFLIAILSVFISFGACNSINSNNDMRFEDDGTLIVDTTLTSMNITNPKKVKFYVEVSGSMNGFFRANCPTKFKSDVWKIISHYSSISDKIGILTNDGSMGDEMSLSLFRTEMNSGAFISTESTKVPVMIQTILENMKEDDEVAILISDMKYSPVGAAAPDVLLTQYSTDISTILGKYKKAVCLVGALSEYLDKNGNSLCDNSPYYYLIIGKDQYVAKVRNDISTFLESNNSFIDNIESGFDYGQPIYSFGIPENCYLKDNENPTFCGFVGDTCSISLKVNLENYRWLLSDTTDFKKALKVKALYGSNVALKSVKIDVQNFTNKELSRTAVAIAEIELYDLATDSEVIEWTLELPDTDLSLFSQYFGATEENDFTKSYSVDNFIKGIFYGGVVNQTLKPNFILISKNS